MKTVQQLMSLQGRVALITGAAGHIGRAMCEALAELGASIAVLDRCVDNCEQFGTELTERFAVETLPLEIDLTDEQQLASACPSVLQRFGGLDILVNCAAFTGSPGLKGWATDFEKQQADAFRQTLDLNLTAPFQLTQSCGEALAASQSGSVVNVASIYALVGPDLRLYENTPLGSPAAYGASKAGLLQLTRWLATVMAPRVRVNAISPGGVWREQPESFHQQYIERTPLRRMASEEEMKGAVAYLASDLSAYVTGQNLVIDGGWTAW